MDTDNSMPNNPADLLDLKNTKYFFEFLTDEKNQQNEQSLLLEDFTQILKINRYMSEFFSKYENKSIYHYLFKLYLKSTTTEIYKNAILNLIKELTLNIEVDQKVFEFIFQRFASLYRDEKNATPKRLNDYLQLLNVILGDTENILKPRNYFACPGEGNFDLSFDNHPKKIGYCLTVILNFKIGFVVGSSGEEDENSALANLMTINFSNGYKINFDLKYPVFLVVKQVRDSFLKTFPSDEWINLIINIVIEKTPTLYFFVNGENHLTPFQLPPNSISNEDEVTSVSFFNNFYGEVSSISMLSQTESGIPGANSSEFLQGFKQFKEGIWKRKNLETFIELTKSIESLNSESKRKKTSISKKNYGYPLPNIDKELIPQRTLFDNLLFIFTPFTTSFSKPNIIENVLSVNKLKLIKNGNIRLHKYFCYQNNLNIIDVIPNILPIAEIFILYPKTLDEENFHIFLKTIENILKFRKKNMIAIKEIKLFQILSLFFEKYPKNFFTETILKDFIEIGKCMFNFESICSSYFKNILLNEKLLAKYSEGMEVKFWDNMMLFVQCDSTLIEKFIEMNRLCLILRFYDRNKYKEMCCEEHLFMIKKEFIGEPLVMNPTMSKKLSQIEGIVNIIINGQDPKNSCSLFKLLTLDLSPCLTKFILNIFIKALQRKTQNNEWQKGFLEELINYKFEVIIINTFIHSLLEIRIVVLQFLFELHQTSIALHKTNYFKTIEKMLKTCLVPQSMFYSSRKDLKQIGPNKDDSQVPMRKSLPDKNFLSKLAGLYQPELVSTNVDNMKNKANTTLFTSPDLENEKNEEKIFIFEDALYEKYKEKILDIFSLWSLGININESFESFPIKKSTIKHSNFLEIIFYYVKQVNDMKLTMKYLQFLELIIDNEQNAYSILLNKKVFTLIIELSFSFFKNPDPNILGCFNKAKSLLSNIFNNSLNYVLKNRVIYPCGEIDILFLWGNQVLLNNTQITKDYLFEFLNELLLEFLTSFKIRFEPKMNFSLNSEFNPKSNFLLKNYLLFISHLFRFSFQYYYDPIIFSEGTSFLPPNSKVNSTIQTYLSAMRINMNIGQKISEQWLDFPFFDDVYKRISPIWSKTNINKIQIKSDKSSKILKYDEMLHKLILDKDNKNIYRKELNILCYEETEEKKEIIIPLVKSMAISLMTLLTAAINSTDFSFWLKEFKYFTRFLIIAPTNLIRTEQLDYYNNMQEICSNVLVSCLCCWKDLLGSNSPYHSKIESDFKSTLIFCFIIIKYQFQYTNSHKINIFKNLRRNDLVASGVFSLFIEKIKDKSGNPLVNYDKIEKYSKNKYEDILNEINSSIWNEALFENNEIKNKLESSFFCFKGYKIFIDSRLNMLKLIKDEIDESYTEDILLLLPLYENELAKYSNNSLETNKKTKNNYKKFKKHSFSWRGFWSNRALFFDDIEKIKMKLKNHYTKSFMRPLLVPILDIDYYLPEFSGFDPATLFNIKNGEKTKLKINMDVDKILKLSDQSFNNINTNNTNNNLIHFMDKKSEDENYLRSIYIKSNPMLALCYKKISNNLDFGKEEEFSVLKQNNENNTNKGIIKKYFLSCLVKASHHIKGVCFIDNEKLNFKVFLNQKTGNAMSDVEVGFTTSDDDYDQERHTCFGSYFVCHPKDKDLYKKSINYHEIKWFFRRRYYYKNSALEIYTITNKTYYFNFKYEEDRETIIREILTKLKDTAKIVYDLKDPKDIIFDNIVGYQNNSLIKVPPGGKKKKHIKLSKKIKKWAEWGMTNFEILMWLNIYGNRSYNDISQYPIFPWVLNNYEDPLKIESDKGKNTSESYNYRDLSLPMGMMTLNEEGERRKQSFLETYDTLKNESDEGSMTPYLFGSNYSNPMYVCNFLMRLFPFTHISIELQGSKFDDPNRLFLSVKNSFYNSITQKTDVRELIPEFFYLPEMFQNINDLNMGVEENGEKVNDVLTPCQNNPSEFVNTMRTVLESDALSYNLQNWIDLIFGYKSKGKEAEAAKNLFTEASYQEDINIAKKEDKESLLRQVEFGLIPTQIMNKECPKRSKKDDIIKDKEITDSNSSITKSFAQVKTDNDIYSIPPNVSLLKIGSFAPEKLTLILNNGLLIEKKISYSIFSKDFDDEITYKAPICKYMNYIYDYYSNDSFNDKVIQIFNYGKSVLMGGFYDGTVKLIRLMEDETKIQEIFPFKEGWPIVSIFVNQEYDYIFLGNTKGNVAIYKISQEQEKYKPNFIISDQYSFISEIYCNNELNLWISASIDGYINLYTLPLCKLVRCIKVPTKSCSYAFIISSPLPCIVAISDEESNNEIFIYSINGKNILKKQEYFRIQNPIVIKDINSNEYLACLSNESIYIYSIPDLYVIVYIDCVPDLRLICTNEDKTLLYALNKNGSKVCILRDKNRKNS